MATNTLTAGQTASVSLPANSSITFLSTSGAMDATVTRGTRIDYIQRRAPFSLLTGPYESDATVEISVTAGSVTFETPAAAEIDHGSIDTAAVQALIAANDDLGLLATPIQALIDAAVADAMARENHTGYMPATSATVAFNNKTVEASLQELYVLVGTPSATAPTIDTAPTISDTTPTVGQTLTFTAGDVTNAADHTSATTWRVNVGGVPVGVFSATDSYVVQSADLGKTITVTQKQTDPVTQLTAERTSAATSAVAGTTPTNSVAPSISPTGTQTAGTTLTVSVGSWSNAATYGIQVYAGGVAVGSRVWQSGTTYDYVPTTQQVGLGITVGVIGRSSLLVESAEVAGSNTVTISGTPTVSNLTAPAWPATVYLDTAADFDPGTWSGTINSTVTWDFYLGGTAPENLYFAGNTLSIHTPRSTYVNALGAALGAGSTIYIKETVTETATGTQYSVFSAGKTVSATSATFAAALTTAGSSGYSLTLNSAMTASVFALLTGGTVGYSVQSVSPALPAGLSISISGGNATLSGTPSTLASLTSHTVTFVDSAGTPATASVSFNITVSAASTSALSPLAYADAAVAISGANTSYNGVTNKVYNGVVVVGPNGDGRNRHRLVQGAPSIAGGVRTELLWFDSHLIEGSAVWMAFDIVFDLPAEFPASTSSYDEFLVFQTHTPFSGDTQPDIALKVSRQSGQLYFRIAGNDAAPSGGTQTTKSPQPSNFAHQTLTQGTRYRFIIKHRAGWLASHNPRIDIWVRNGSATTWTQLVTNYNTYPNTYNHGGDTSKRAYVRIGGYKWSSSNWANSPISWVSSNLHYGIGEDLFAEAAAALNF